MNLVFQKYVLGLGWRVTCLAGTGVAAEAAPPGAGSAAFEPALAFLDSQVAQLEARSGHYQRISCNRVWPTFKRCSYAGSAFESSNLDSDM